MHLARVQRSIGDLSFAEVERLSERFIHIYCGSAFGTQGCYQDAGKHEVSSFGTVCLSVFLSRISMCFTPELALEVYHRFPMAQ